MPKQQTAIAELADLLPRVRRLVVEALADTVTDCGKQNKHEAIAALKKYITMLQAVVATAEATVEEPL